ncbi:hypothetical protein C0L86_01580 [Streptomyces sp. SCA2-2]|nr:hypothetical protein C0L86_01580 [Streptomyces sp. SCA2-2]
MRRPRTTGQSTSPFLLLLVALLLAQLCVQGHTGLRGGSEQLTSRGQVLGVPVAAPTGDRASGEYEVSIAAVGESATDSTEVSDSKGGACPERQAPEQSSSPHLAAPAAAGLPSVSVAPATFAARWPTHNEGSSAKAPPAHICVLRI